VCVCVCVCVYVYVYIYTYICTGTGHILNHYCRKFRRKSSRPLDDLRWQFIGNFRIEIVQTSR